VISVDLYARVRNSLLMHTRPRVHRAPGIPARPLFSRVRQNNGKPRAERAARMRTHVSVSWRPHPSTSLRGALATKQPTLASLLAARWIASLTLAMTLRDSSQFVGWAKARLRRAHHLSFFGMRWRARCALPTLRLLLAMVFNCHRPPPGRRNAPPDDRLRRAIQYSRDASDRIEKPRLTGSSGQAGR